MICAATANLFASARVCSAIFMTFVPTKIGDVPCSFDSRKIAISVIVQNYPVRHLPAIHAWL